MKNLEYKHPLVSVLEAERSRLDGAIMMLKWIGLCGPVFPFSAYPDWLRDLIAEYSASWRREGLISWRLEG